MAVFFRNIWDLESTPSPELAVAAESDLLVINSAEMLSKMRFPIKTTTILSIVCISGKLTLDIDLDTFEMSSNTLMVLGPSRTITDIRASEDFNGFSIIASSKMLNTALPFMSRVVVCFMHFRDNPVIALTDNEIENQKMFHDLLQRKMLDLDATYAQVVLLHLGQAILFETLGLYSDHLISTVPSNHRRSEELFYHFLTEVERHFKRERSVSFYADRLSVTPKHLSAVVKESSGRTAGEWIDSYVIMEAKIQLTSSDKSVQQIASELNFPNQSFFGKYFKHHTGTSPRQYRTGLL